MLKIQIICCIIIFDIKFFSTTALVANSITSIWSNPYTTINSRRYGYPGYCPQGTECLPLISCPILNNIMNHACLQTSRIGNLGCGYEGSGLVCCPKIQEEEPRVFQDRGGCGIPSVQRSGGIGAHPWTVRIGFRNPQGEIKYACGGSIITNQVILTAAHCALAKSDNFKLSSVRVGEWDANAKLNCGREFCSLPAQSIAISHVIVHPGYQKENYKDDIALVVLQSPINFTVTARAICLPDSWSSVGNEGTLVGWGQISGQIETPAVQQILHLPIVDLQQCVNIYGRTVPITDEHLCVGGQKGRDACAGFGGFPLLEQQGDIFYQIGILSFGSEECGTPGVPSVYLNVKKYVSWIQENIPQIYNNA